MTSGYVLSDEVLDHKINEPAYPKKSSYKAERSLNDLDLFTKGQPVDFYKELRDNAPVYFHDPMPTDPEPGYWVLTCLLYTSPSPRDYAASRMPSSA